MKFLPRDFDAKEIEHLRQIVLPSGIGEFQWVMTKLTNVGEKLAVFGLDGAPRRLHQFAELHPNIEAFGYIGFDYSQIRSFQKELELDTWEKITGMFGPGQMVMLACNPHLEAGNALHTWMPDLPTSYTYPTVLSDVHTTEANRVLYGSDQENFLIGISCASYRGAEAWNTWGSVQWTDLLTWVQRDFPHAKFVLMGGSWDDLTSAVYNPDGPIRFQVDKRGIPPVGTTSFGGAMAIMHRLGAYIGFSSGLGHVAAHLCGCPVFMLWPEHEQLLSKTWVNPELLDNGSYVPSRWLAPNEVYKTLKPWLQRHYKHKKVA